MQSLVHSVWHTQHQLWRQDALVHTMCMHPPDRSVGVLHLGHGLVRVWIAAALATSQPMDLEATARSTLKPLPPPAESGGSSTPGRQQAPVWYSMRHLRQKVNPQPPTQVIRSQSASGIIPWPHPGRGHRTPPTAKTASSVAQRW